MIKIELDNRQIVLRLLNLCGRGDGVLQGLKVGTLLYLFKSPLQLFSVIETYGYREYSPLA